MDYKKESLIRHAAWKGKIEVVPRCELKNRDDLSTAYTPGVAQPCLEIQADPDKSYEYTRRGNLVAVISDGSAVLGLGNIGGLAGMPVMEGKCALFKAFGGVDAFPIVLSTQDTDKVVEAICAIAPSFGGINLEDISAPRCFEIERRLIEALDIPVFHDDQHGTAVVVLGALYNALKLTGKRMETLRICMSGPGAAGTAIAKLLLSAGARDIVMCDRSGILHTERPGISGIKAELARLTNPRGLKGSLAEAMRGADVFIGVSAGGLVTADMIAGMGGQADCIRHGQSRSGDYARRGHCRRRLYCRQRPQRLYESDQQRAGVSRNLPRRAGRARQAHHRGNESGGCRALADMVPEDKLRPEFIIPDALDPTVAAHVAAAVKEAAHRGE